MIMINQRCLVSVNGKIRLELPTCSKHTLQWILNSQIAMLHVRKKQKAWQFQKKKKKKGTMQELECHVLN